MRTLTYPKEVKARKDHTCNFCSEQIRKGMKYEFSTFIVDDGPYSWKAHIYCSKLADRLNMYDEMVDTGLTGEDFREYISEAHNNILIKQLPKEGDYSDISGQLIHVSFHYMLWFLIRHYKKIDEKKLTLQE